ncbi:phage major capsid protein [Glycocaulis alkaliphilus]|nr:phage major capsid protein [Glycocaulis alkaliphilus]GGB70672.1 hypothetical protein GCM10007417_08080 [Glycocaulis alkaliphilus]
MTLAELKERRAKKVAEARKISTDAGASPSDDARKRFDEVETEIRSLDEQITREQRLAEWERSAEADPVSGSDGDFHNACQAFSITRAVAAQVPDLAPYVDAGREREISQELARRSNRSVNGILAPMAVFQEKRVLTSTTPAGGPGSNIIPTQQGEFIDILRARLLVQQRGARVLSGLSGNLDLPKLKASATAGWVAENTALTPSDHEFTKVQMTPKHVGALTEFSRNMLLQSSPDIEQLIRADFASVLAEAVDAAAIQGGGSNEPNGILETAGIGTVDFSTPGWAAVLEFIEKIATANADAGAMGWATNPSVVRLLRSTLKVPTDAGAGFLMDGPGELAGYALSSSTIVPNNLSDGGDPEELDRSALIFGNWSDLLVGYWSAFEILVNPYESTAYKKGNVQVRGMITCDVAVRHAESFVAATNIDTAQGG